MTWQKSLATLAVIAPDWPLVRSLITTWKPADVSCKSTVSVSPDCIIRSALGSGVKVARVESTGLAGACATPLRVMNAKLTGSMPTELRQAALLSTPVFWLRLNQSIVSAAHHLLGSQPSPACP